MSAGGPDPSFDRVRPRTPRVDPSEPAGGADPSRPTDREGKRALFSDVAAPPATGAVSVVCGACGQRTVVSWLQGVRLALPGVVLPVPGRGTRAWMRCPACRRRAWVQVSTRA